MTEVLKPLLFSLSVGAIIACSGVTGEEADSDSNNASFKVSTSGMPFNGATRVVVEFTGIEVDPEDAEAEGSRLELELDEPRSIDLVEFQGSDAGVLLGDVELEAGRYASLRLQVNAESGVTDSFIERADGTIHPLVLPAGAEQGLRVADGFTIANDGRSDFTIDVDLRKSIRRPSDQDDDYSLIPALRMVDDAKIGHLVGLVDEQIARSDDCFDAAASRTSAAVYVYEGENAEPGDVCVPDDAGTCPDDVDRPLATAVATSNGGDATGFTFDLGFLVGGAYTAALTCDTDGDDPERDDRDPISYKSQQNFSVTVGEESEIDFRAEEDGGDGTSNGDESAEAEDDAESPGSDS